ncbi:hypothetical protein CFIMG_007796RA00001 [Ceratocystis fimbriata CBS 114723]|uniref:Uncharacterized protein n=1 Tax=Ceratocystis fimbriata CBS 114723 TaxID=1035309 RepID=A0A2C5WSU0_9PEZI|nr:hypothetical protein CFIMG_007796RA00001 [Ceratocystis fimbriata CBS 114723]
MASSPVMQVSEDRRYTLGQFNSGLCTTIQSFHSGDIELLSKPEVNNTGREFTIYNIVKVPEDCNPSKMPDFSPLLEFAINVIWNSLT